MRAGDASAAEARRAREADIGELSGRVARLPAGEAERVLAWLARSERQRDRDAVRGALDALDAPATAWRREAGGAWYPACTGPGRAVSEFAKHGRAGDADAGIRSEWRVLPEGETPGPEVTP